MGISAGHKSAILEHSRRTSESTPGPPPPRARLQSTRDDPDAADPRQTNCTFRRTILSQLPNALSAARFAMAALWIQLAAGGHRERGAFVAIAIAAAASDFIDGRIARHLGVATASGRWLDAVADVTFVLAALFSAAAARAIPYYIPILIAASFSQYALDSILISRAATPARAEPIKSRLGHWGGIINYALVIALAVAPGPADNAASRAISSSFASMHFVGVLVRALAPILAIFYCAAIAERALGYHRR